MIEMSLGEAQLFRMLRAFFGEERVLWNMSVRTVCCSENTVDGSVAIVPQDAMSKWGNCLFTVVDGSDAPKMVVELAPDFSEIVDTHLLERQQYLPKLLMDKGIKYVVFSKEEFRDILDPGDSLELLDVLKDRFGIEDE